MSVTHKRLGGHGALVSNLCLGTMNFGWQTNEEDSFRQTLKKLDEIWPGPGGEAPQAYAW